MRQIDLNELLEGAQRRGNFIDGSAERVWRKATNMKKKTGSMLRWLIPAAAACAALVCLFAIPQARAGVLYALGGALDQLSPDRATKAPEFTSLRVVEEKTGGEWIRNVKAEVENASYDGQYLDLTIAASGEGIENFYFEEAPARAVPIYEKSMLAREVSLGEIYVSAGGNSQTLIQDSADAPVRTGEGEYSFHVRYDAEGCATLNGIVQAALRLDCLNMQYDVDSGYGGPVGTLELRFPVDLTQGNAAARRLYPQNDNHPLSGRILLTTEVDIQNEKVNIFNAEKTLDGLSMQVTAVICKPMETFIRIRLAKTSEDNRGVINNLLDVLSVKADAGGELTARIIGYNDDNLELSVLGVPESAKKLTLRFYYRYVKEVNSVALDTLGIVTLDRTDDKGFLYVYSDPLELPGGTFTVELP